MKTSNLIFKNAMVIILLLLMNNAFAQVYYVDRDNYLGNGSSNKWPGTLEQPKHDLQGDWFRVGLKPGDTVVIVQAASYGSIYMTSSGGSEDQPIVIKPYPGHTIISDASIIPSQFGVKLPVGVSNVHIQGPLKIIGREYSYVAEGNNTGLKLSNAEIYGCDHGPRLSGTTNSEFRDLEIHDLQTNGFQLRGSASAATGEPCKNILVENVNVYNVDDDRTPENSDADGFHSFGGEEIKFINCNTWNNAEDGFDLNSNAIMINCKSYGNDSGGLKVWRREGDNYAPKTVTAINCIFSDNGYDHDGESNDTNPGVKVSIGAALNLYNCVITDNYDQGLHVRVNLNDDPAGITYMPVKVYNTIITGTKEGAAIRDGGYLANPDMPLLESDYNLYYNNKYTNQGYTLGEHSIVNSEPLYVDAANLDFRPLENSPVINKGFDISSIDDVYAQYGLEDFSGNVRPVQSIIDIGAYEYTGNVQVTYTLTYTAGANGSISGVTPQVVEYSGNGASVEAIANSGYKFVSWSDGSTENPRTDVNVTGNITVTATFEANEDNGDNTYGLNYVAGENGSIMGNTNQTVNQGEDGTMVGAIPPAGYLFVGWSDGSTENPRTDVNVVGDISVTANFALGCENTTEETTTEKTAGSNSDSTIGESYNYFNSKKLKLYPIPAGNSVTILNGVSDAEASYEIFTLSGEKVKQGKVLSNTIDFSGLSKQIYIVKLKVNNKVSLHKVIKG
ncbi:InlB B-repeat-containing protein [Abyssalbus ytuae]|uniref:InlB B-repeat-containing protein n=1 Tax=Abyssalbus ytuae TaxID=2926907 RepID=A0A9E6ZPJ2_9FLAO|nr:InlB B-repeat-containing protein [Abyssalbus ytuae]UOB18529.1 InlB B-repeat-containing protein [Abyssalbus ytuae]